jgi:hypothetical protein
MVNQTAANAYLNQSCASAPTECAQWVQSACGTGCSGSCDVMSNTCDLDLQVGVYKMVDLNTDNPELATTAKEPVIKVSIDSINYVVPDNSLNVGTPGLTIYVAPMSVMSPSDPMAEAIGTIPGIPPNTTFTQPMAVQFTDTGKQRLVDIMGSYKTPFNIIVGSTITIKMGDMLPMGKLTAEVDITAHAGL